VRSDLKTVEGLSNIMTDLDDQTCSFEIDAAADVEATLNGLAEKNNKLKDWTRQD
jgi:hypothetical protein